MKYIKTIWSDRSVERPRTYFETTNIDNSITHTPAEGVIYNPGKEVNAIRLNNIEDQIEYLSNIRNIYNFYGLED